MSDTVTESIRADFVDVTEDRFRCESFIIRELAMDVINSMLGLNSLAVREEEERNIPDEEKLAGLLERRSQLMSERMSVYYNNREVMESCINRYCPIVKVCYAKTE